MRKTIESFIKKIESIISNSSDKIEKVNTGKKFSSPNLKENKAYFAYFRENGWMHGFENLYLNEKKLPSFIIDIYKESIIPFAEIVGYQSYWHQIALKCHAMIRYSFKKADKGHFVYTLNSWMTGNLSDQNIKEFNIIPASIASMTIFNTNIKDYIRTICKLEIVYILKNKPPHRDNNLLSALYNNEEYKIKQIYKEAFPRIAYFIKNNGGTIEDAKDIFQDTLIDVYKNSRFLILTCKFSSYLFVLSRSKWFNSLRKGGREIQIDDFSSLMDFWIEFNNNEGNTKYECVKIIFKTLSEKCKDLILSELSGRDGSKNSFESEYQSLKEVAHEYNITPSNASTSKGNCVRKFIKLYGHCLEKKTETS